MQEIENAPCSRCGKPVHLLHDPPCDCGNVRCDMCPPCPTCWPEDAA